MRAKQFCLSTCQHYSNKNCPVSIFELNHSVCPLSIFILQHRSSNESTKGLPWTRLIRSARALVWLTTVTFTFMISFFTMVTVKIAVPCSFHRKPDYRSSSLCVGMQRNHISICVVFCCLLHSLICCSDNVSDSFLKKLILNNQGHLNLQPTWAFKTISPVVRCLLAKGFQPYGFQWGHYIDTEASCKKKTQCHITIKLNVSEFLLYCSNTSYK